MTRWRCRHCQQTVTLHITPAEPPVCHHHNQPTGHKPTVMDVDEPAS